MSALQKAMDHLSEKERDVVRAYMMEKDPKNLNARFKQGVSQEIAANLDISMENLRQTYLRAIKKLKKHLDQNA
jgi:RNA polymerase sigma factor (sigma-70 family)